MSAIEVRGAYKFYGRTKDPHKKVILNYLNMKVQTGSIYGLLGASGCGKTTLLSCIVGQKQMQKGHISVLGTDLATYSARELGPRIGYMPQDIALTNEMTIEETIFYFGRIYGMDEDRIRERFKILNELFELPDGDRNIENMSGGQQRRVSFACALLHEPELLLLDEPTVGLDPLLREKIWNFLVETTRTSKLAVIITTHYIEEARQADSIGMMRNGVLLAEDSPTNLMQQFGCDNLEDAFLVLIGRFDASEEAGTTVDRAAEQNTLAVSSGLSMSTVRNETMECTSTVSGKSFRFTTRQRMRALLTRNFLHFIRQPAGILMAFLFPMLQCMCLYVAVSDKAMNLQLGVVNEEVPNWLDCYDELLVTAHVKDYECNLSKISCRYLRAIDAEYIKLRHYDSVAKAYRESRKANVIGFIHFASNFTKAFKDIMDNGRDAMNSSFVDREIRVRLDFSNQPVVEFLRHKLYEAYSTFAQNLMTDCGLSKALASTPVTVHQQFKIDRREYVAIGFLLMVVFFAATSVSVNAFLVDRIEGNWERTLVAGITTTELLFAHMINQSVVVSLQCISVIVFVDIAFVVTSFSENLDVIALLVLSGIAGMLFGLLISIHCESYTLASLITMGMLLPMFLLCGIFWPLSGMPKWLRVVAHMLPFTLSSISLRNILAKDVPITDPSVYNGFAALLLFIGSIMILCSIGLRSKK